MTRLLTDYSALSLSDLTRLLGRNMPRGLAWDGKADESSNIYKLFEAQASQIRALEDRISRMSTEWYVPNTTDLIVEWETAVGIPDECRKRAETIEQRRLNVVTKLKRIPTIDVEDYKNLAEAVTGFPADEWDIKPAYLELSPVEYYHLFVLLVVTPQDTGGKWEYPFGNDAQLSVTNLTRVGGLVTATVSSTTTMIDGSQVLIAGAVETDYNGYHIITITGGTTFTYEIAATPATPATGTITVDFGVSITPPLLDVSGGECFIDEGILFPGYPFGSKFRSSILECVFRKVTPANVAIIYE